MIGFIKVLSPQQDLARFQRVSLDVAALLFCFGATMLTALLFGLIPALKLSKTNLGATLKDEGSRSSLIGPGQQRMQSILIMAQLALACVLLIGAGLLARSFQATQSLPLGFNPDHLLAVQIELPSIRYESDKHRFTFFENLLEKVRRLPGVSAAAVNPDPPFNDWSDVEPFGLTGKPDAEPGQEPTLEWQDVMPGYFQTSQFHCYRVATLMRTICRGAKAS
jgi:putative ABC transport system permease protein